MLSDMKEMMEDKTFLSSSKIVSIVDDEADITSLFHDALSSINRCRILEFSDPVDALEHFKLNIKNYVLVISDLRMPVINGMQLLKTAKDLNSHARTILMTALAINDNIIQDYIKNGIVNALLLKPKHLPHLV